jgi:uncharacterized protein with GYD domain
MIFIALGKFKKKPTKESVAANDKLVSQLLAQNPGIKSLGTYYTLGRYDVVAIWDLPDKGAVEMMMKSGLALFDQVSGETLVAVKREDGAKLLD